MSHLRWTSKSTYDLADELVRRGFQASAELVRRLLHQMGYSLQAPAKAKESTAHPDRDVQFGYLNKAVSRFVKDRQPVISVDTKKKELIGEYANRGRERHPEGAPTRVAVHDFVDPEVGRAIPYGIYDVANDEGWVSVGDTAANGPIVGPQALQMEDEGPGILRHSGSWVHVRFGRCVRARQLAPQLGSPAVADLAGLSGFRLQIPRDPG